MSTALASELHITTRGASKLADRIEANGPNPPGPEPACAEPPAPKPPGPEAALGPNEAERRSSLSELTQAGQRVYAEVGVAFDGELDLRLVNHLGACGA